MIRLITNNGNHKIAETFATVTNRFQNNEHQQLSGSEGSRNDRHRFQQGLPYYFDASFPPIDHDNHHLLLLKPLFDPQVWQAKNPSLVFDYSNTTASEGSFNVLPIQQQPQSPETDIIPNILVASLPSLEDHEGQLALELTHEAADSIDAQIIVLLVPPPKSSFWQFDWKQQLADLLRVDRTTKDFDYVVVEPSQTHAFQELLLENGGILLDEFTIRMDDSTTSYNNNNNSRFAILNPLVCFGLPIFFWFLWGRWLGKMADSYLPQSAAILQYNFSSQDVGPPQVLPIHNNDEEPPCCAICLEDMTPGTTKVCVLPCRHYFHPHCMDEWLSHASASHFHRGLQQITSCCWCPLCKYDLTQHCLEQQQRRREASAAAPQSLQPGTQAVEVEWSIPTRHHGRVLARRRSGEIHALPV
ncbi:Zinc finger, C3HC4 type (RING finger) [Seminavis robusta]|uniref:Zinc finger, C3HC4 type (RING finger) n=1 Tax=Seminavis robusta TaxID=568900 RepID=A0A9N8EK96_9STRA|nr:Zinc finger, C3HC4 type (RING finger) [Seminavis robusta]|eukprot:Sro1325_g262870.1 Zinc finger, C3HC4 type (RING finger) (415) ;mRNA; f:5709-6953